jgi:hypothetical protein
VTDRSAAAATSAGWYPSPGHSGEIEYWNGRAWTGQRRPRPAWSSTGPDPSGDPDDSARKAALAHRKKRLFLAGVGVLSLVALALAYVATRPQSEGPRVVTDAAFVKAANSACDRVMPTLRQPDAGPFGTTVTPAQAADAIDTAATGLDHLATELAALPLTAVNRPFVAQWLADWSRYTAVGRKYAGALRAQPTASHRDLLAQGDDAQHAADRFALANGLGSCTFFVVYQPNPENGI